jgi:hypothetical protein
MKQRIQINLSERAHGELKRRAEAAGLTRQALIEGWLTEGVPAGTRLVDVFPDGYPDDSVARTNSLSSDAKVEREAKKAARARRKAELGSQIADTLPARVMAIADKVEAARPHKFHSGASPVPGCKDCLDLVG